MPAGTGAAALLFLLLAALSAGIDTSPAASSATVVSATVPSAVSMTNNCPTAGKQFGIVQPGSTATTATASGQVCSFDFTSSNDTAMVRLHSAEGAAPAMRAGTTVAYTASDDRIVSGIATSGPSEAWALENRGQIAKWNGTTWSPSTSLSGSFWFNDIVLAPGTSGATAVLWVPTSILGSIMKSTDGGATFTAQTLPAGANCNANCSVQALDAVSSTLAMAAVKGTDGVERMIKTTDGTTWTVVNSALPANAPPVSIAFINSLTAYYTAFGIVRQTVDGGATWTNVTPAGFSGLAVDAVGTSAVLAVGESSNVARFDGTTWTVTTIAEPSRIYDVSMASATSATAAGHDGAIFTWNGVTWTQQPAVPGISGQLGVVAMASPTTAFAGGGSGLVAGNSSGSWGVQRTPTANATRKDVAAFANGRTLVAVGDRGIITRSTDGGTTWAAVTSPTTVALRSVAASGDTTAVAVGDGGTVVRSTDAGATWTLVAATATGTRLNAVDIDSDTGLAVAGGTGGVMVRSWDSGSTWQLAATAGVNSIRAIDLPEGGKGMVLATAPYTVYRSTNAGASWTSVLPGGVLTDLSSTSTTDVWIGSGIDVVWHSTDGGLTFAPLYTSNSRSIVAVSAVDDRTAWVVDSFGEVLRTTDGGSTWAGPNVFPGYWQHALVALGAQRAVTVGEAATAALEQSTGSITDFGGGNNWSSGPTTSTFGYCLQGISAQTLADPVVDLTNTPGTCQAVAADPWQAVPTAPTRIAKTGGAGQAGRVDLVWGMRAASNQPAKTYFATIVVEAMAPAV